MSCEARAAANIRVVVWGLDGHIGKQDPTRAGFPYGCIEVRVIVRVV